MKIKFVIIFTFLAFIKAEFSHSQHSEKFVELTQNLKPIDSIVKIKKFTNGKIKEISKFLVYEYGEYTYEIVSGKQQLFDKKGRLFYEVFYGSFGNLIYQKQFNNKNQLYRIIETTKIDLKPETTLYQILNSNKKTLIESYEKEYNSNEKEGNLKLWKEGKWLNGRKIGKWKTYNFCDETFKIKEYKRK
ncbi:hypothetical protein [Polaribacter sp. AHE13PA]|uniref:hypothetical protein n=1 Tax=Polaribacter sp. AHE13PA TaxID=2745562 RepID=UPI001C4F594D|nr:hypothetical protein [Polaribacter sp. AHE13PA]QXP68507.1 hypothetical protein H0I28_08485 [Polaribacter sp. AHE13PA]QXP68525.1 hypothetical protein H0I28_08585 [Polaribacter sp. AHE13PA]